MKNTFEKRRNGFKRKKGKEMVEVLYFRAIPQYSFSRFSNNK
jgi:hypothetical protein